MDSLNASSAVQANMPNFAYDYASEIDNETDQGDLFTDMLSQAQSASPQSPASSSTSPNPPTQPAAQQPLSPPPPSQQPPQNNAANSANASNNADTQTNSSALSNPASSANNANGANDANNSNTSSSTNDSDSDPNNINTDASSPPGPQTVPSGPPLVGKSSRRHSKDNADSTNTKTTSNTNADNKSGQPVAVTTVAVVNQTASNITTASQGNTNTDPTDDTEAPSSADSASGFDTAANTPPANISLPDPGTAPASQAPSNAGPVTNTDPASNNDPVLNAGLILNADPKAGNTTPVNGGDNSNTDPVTSVNDPANTDNGVTSSHLMMMLMQLEHLAGQTAAQGSSIGLPAASNTSQTPNTGNAQRTTATSGDQSKIDLKALMTEIARLNDGANDGSADLQNDADVTNITQNTPSSSSSTSSSQNTTAAWGNASSNTDTKWISPDFLNLFSLPSNNPVTDPNASSVTPILFNTGVASGTVSDGNDGASLDADTQGQTGAGVRDDTILSNTNSPPPAMGPAQAASPYDFASQLSAMRATQGGSTGLPPAIDQVILQMSRNLSSDGSSSMSIQLRPAELGRVDVKLTIGSDGKVQGTVTADNPSTLNLLLKDVRGLERALQEAGLRADSGSLQFGLRGDGQAGGGSSQTGSNASAFADDSIASASAGTILPGFADPTETYYLTPGGVNMRV